MKQLTKLKCKYCSWCESQNCKSNKAKCHKYSKRLLNKKMRQINKKCEELRMDKIIGGTKV